MSLLPDHASPECHVGRYRFTSHPNCDRGEFSNLSLRMHRKSRVEQYMRKIVPLARPKWRNPSIICYEPLERFIDIMERRQSNGGQQRHYPFRHPKWRYPYLEGPSTRPYTPTRSLLLQIHSHSNLANR